MAHDRTRAKASGKRLGFMRVRQGRHDEYAARSLATAQNRRDCCREMRDVERASPEDKAHRQRPTSLEVDGSVVHDEVGVKMLSRYKIDLKAVEGGVAEHEELHTCAIQGLLQPGDCGRCVREQRVWKLQRDTSMIAASNVRGSSFDIEVEGGMLGSGNLKRDGACLVA